MFLACLFDPYVFEDGPQTNPWLEQWYTDIMFYHYLAAMVMSVSNFRAATLGTKGNA